MAIYLPNNNNFSGLMQGLGQGMSAFGQNDRRRHEKQQEEQFRQGMMQLKQDEQNRINRNQQQEQEGFQQLSGMVAGGQRLGMDALSLPGAAGQRAATIFSLQNQQDQNIANQRLANQRLAWEMARARETGKGQDKWTVDAGRGMRFNPMTGEAQPLYSVGEDGTQTPWMPPQTAADAKTAVTNAAVEALQLPPEQRTPEQQRTIDVAKGLKLVSADAGIDRKPDESRDRYANVVLDDITKLRDMAGDYWVIPNTGIGGSVFSKVPGTTAHDMSSTLNTVKASIGFDRLQDMRNNSPTGGALGNVSDTENKLLQAAYGSLEQSQSEKQFLENLDRVERNMLDVIHGKGNWSRDEQGLIQVGEGVGASDSNSDDWAQYFD